MPPQVVHFVGRSNSGKTTLITRLIPLFKQKRLKVGSLKQTHHQVEFDQKDKDSWKHRNAGSEQILLLSESKLALHADRPENSSLTDLIEKWFSQFDVVLVEGFKNEKGLNIEVCSAEIKESPLYQNPKYNISAVVSDNDDASLLPHFKRDEVLSIFTWITKQTNL